MPLPGHIAAVECTGPQPTLSASPPLLLLCSQPDGQPPHPTISPPTPFLGFCEENLFCFVKVLFLGTQVPPLLPSHKCHNNKQHQKANLPDLDSIQPVLSKDHHVVQIRLFIAEINIVHSL